MEELTNKEIEMICRGIAKDMCTQKKYAEWLETAFTQTDSQWHSVVAEVAQQGCPTAEIEKLPRDRIRVFVYTCIKSPLYKSNGEVLLIFKLADSIWSQIINYTPPSVNSD